MNSADATRGRLWLVPTPLDFGCDPLPPITDSLPDGVLRRASVIQHWICENARTTRAFLLRVGLVHPLCVPIQEMRLVELPRDLRKKGDRGAAAPDMRSFLAPAIQGQDMGLVSEAGLPAVADPGGSVVRAAHELGLVVTALPGAASLTLALAASGLNGQSFAFVGYLPTAPSDRARRIRDLERLATSDERQAQILIETPYRNEALLAALLEQLRPTTWLSVSQGLTLDQARNWSRPVARWRQAPTDLDNRIPAVFVIGS